MRLPQAPDARRCRRRRRRRRPHPPASFPPSLTNAVVAALQPDTSSREIGRLAVWSVTTAKPGNGVELLRDGRDDTYWQSDGAQPHLVNIQFQKKVGGPGACLPPRRCRNLLAPH